MSVKQSSTTPYYINDVSYQLLFLERIRGKLNEIDSAHKYIDQYIKDYFKPDELFECHHCKAKIPWSLTNCHLGNFRSEDFYYCLKPECTQAGIATWGKHIKKEED